MTTKEKGRRGNFVHCSNWLTKIKKGAQKQRGHLMVQDAGCSFGMPIYDEREKRGQG